MLFPNLLTELALAFQVCASGYVPIPMTCPYSGCASLARATGARHRTATSAKKSKESVERRRCDCARDGGMAEEGKSELAKWRSDGFIRAVDVSRQRGT